MRFLQQLWEQHDLTTMWAKSSLSNSRAIRWFGITAQILLSLFVDAVLFGIVFPDLGVCEGYSTEKDCTTPINEYTIAPLCLWTTSSVTISDNLSTTTTTTTSSCSPEGPPNTIYFTMILALVTILLTIPMSMTLDYIISEFCNTRPDLEAWGIDRYLSFLLYFLSLHNCILTMSNFHIIIILSNFFLLFFCCCMNIPVGYGWAPATAECLKKG